MTMKTSRTFYSKQILQSLSVFIFACLSVTESFGAVTRTSRPAIVSAQIQNCLSQAGKQETANARDAAKLLCLQTFASFLAIDKCLSVARSMAYFSTSNKALLICGSDVKKITAEKCLAISREITYSETADELKWNCLSKFKKSMPLKQCLETAKEMSILPLQNKAIEFCSM
jgi:hypothetical protein